MARSYDWQRQTSPKADPVLRFDTHFQSDGLPTPPDANILVAVSGGSDSIALLHLLKQWQAISGIALHVATVDHTLRAESANEAEFVGQVCQALNLPHTILTWARSPRDTKKSADARVARFRLLHHHALQTGATAIALGHTRNDQIETVRMRAARGGGTIGLSGMAMRTGLEIDGQRVDLYRPLLQVTRQRLRDHLRASGHGWMEDPSNDDSSYERVRVRQALSKRAVIETTNVEKFAELCGRSRSWLSLTVAKALAQHGRKAREAAHFTPPKTLPRLIVAHGLEAIIRRMGAASYRLPLAKLDVPLDAFEADRPLQFAVGRTLVTVKDSSFKIEPETNRKEPRRKRSERFIPAFDAPVERALNALWPLPR